MYIKSLTLQNFRNFEKKSFEFEPLTVIVGPNAVGKTNTLEAIHLLSSGRSFRANVEQEMIMEEKEVAHVDGVFNNEELGDFTLEAVLTRGFLQGDKVSKKKLSVNEV
ncbi:MAG: AAA family ATPase, partial [bacterium]|nr:AAA family ATPase [bacterium]